MAIASIELNFDPTSFDTATNELFKELGELQSARSEYETLKGQISNFWKGTEAEEAKKTIEANIKMVDQAYENVKKQKETYSSANETASQQRAEFKAAMEEAKAAVQDLFT